MVVLNNTRLNDVGGPYGMMIINSLLSFGYDDLDVFLNNSINLSD
jgi:hypothetical protein